MSVIILLYIPVNISVNVPAITKKSVAHFLSFLHTGLQNNERFCFRNTRFVIGNTFVSNDMKSTENQTKAKQHSEAELLLFKNYSHSSSTLSSKNNRRFSSKKYTKTTASSVLMRLYD